ncbi:hypothetical protein KGY77_08285 [Candidatus Bipolaricaulota bacterium]|nr:hypothetical protein [Candidatus Bipolaricaulota bacterium]
MNAQEISEEEKEEKFGEETFRRQLKENSEDKDFVEEIRKELGEASELKPDRAFTTMDI